MPETHDLATHSGGPNPKQGKWTRKLLVLAAVLAVAAAIYVPFRDTLSLDYLASQESQLRQWQTDAPWRTAVAAVTIYVVVAGLSLPGAVVLTLVCGWYFGFWKALLIVSFGSTGGAMVAFLLGRYLFRDWVQTAMHDRLTRINEAFEREGAYYLFTLRLVPVVPFFAINAIMGLTSIRASTFWWVSQLGMLPGTAAYVFAGTSVPNLATLAQNGVGTILNWQLLAAFAVIGVLPLTVKRIVERAGRTATHT